MKQNLRKVIPILLLGSSVFGAVAQDESRGVVRRRDNDRNATQSVTAVSERMQNFFGSSNSSITDADRQWQKVSPSIRRFHIFFCLFDNLEIYCCTLSLYCPLTASSESANWFTIRF